MAGAWFCGGWLITFVVGIILLRVAVAKAGGMDKQYKLGVLFFLLVILIVNFVVMALSNSWLPD